MKVVIIEDEKIAAQRLEQMLHEIDSSIEILAKIDSVSESVKWLSTNMADLLFLDIELSDGLSFSIFEKVHVQTPIIFTTAYDEYALKAFELNSISYLVKPIIKESLHESLSKYHSLQSVFNFDIDKLLSYIKGNEPTYKEHFVIQIGDKIRRIEIASIAYFYAFEKCVFITTFQNKTYPIDFSLDALESLLNPKHFFRINRKMLINMKSIVNMTSFSRSSIMLELNPAPDNHIDTLVSAPRSANFRKWLE